MPDTFAELGRGLLQERRNKEREKNANTMAKMRQDTLMQQAQSEDDMSRGAQTVMQTIDPLVNMWQANAAQMSRDTAAARSRANLTSTIAMDALRENIGSAGAGTMTSGTMSDAHSMYKNMMRMDVLSGINEGKLPSKWKWQYTMPGVDYPGEAGQKEMTKTFAEEQKQHSSIIKDVMADLNNELDALRVAARKDEFGKFKLDPRLFEEEKQALSLRRIETLTSMGIPVPSVLYAYAGIDPVMLERAEQKPPLERRSTEIPAGPEGAPVFRGRKDIVHGKTSPSQFMQPLTGPEEREITREAYRKATREVFPSWPDEDIDRLIDDLIAKPIGKPSKPGPAETPRETRALGGPLAAAQKRKEFSRKAGLEKMIFEMKKRQAKAKRTAERVRRQPRGFMTGRSA